jgi:hypothetical protein
MTSQASNASMAPASHGKPSSGSAKKFIAVLKVLQFAMTSIRFKF